MFFCKINLRDSGFFCTFSADFQIVTHYRVELLYFKTIIIGEIKQVELDVVAESLDKKHILIGECKWTTQEDVSRLHAELQSIAPYLPFVKKGQHLHIVYFMKNPPTHAEGHSVFLPADVLIAK